MQMIPLNKGRKRRGTKESLDEDEKRSEKSGLKLNIQKTKAMASGPITSWQTGKNGNSGKFYFPGLQNHCRQLTVAMKLKDACSLEEKL